jgi:hypothetical protein
MVRAHPKDQNQAKAKDKRERKFRTATFLKRKETVLKSDGSEKRKEKREKAMILKGDVSEKRRFLTSDNSEKQRF